MDGTGFSAEDVLFEMLANVTCEDPRLPPYPEAATDKASAALGDSRRWLSNGADTLAIRLQYGRGVTNPDICEQFGISKTTLTRISRAGQWSRALSIANRKSLSLHIWTAGLARQQRRAETDQPEAFSMAALTRLLAASAWETIPPKAPVWTPLDGSAHATAPAMQPDPVRDEKEALLDNPANPDRTYRDKVATNLDRLIERLERKQREKAAAAAAEVAKVNDGEAEKPSNDGP